MESQRKYPSAGQGLSADPVVEVGAGWEKQMVCQTWDVTAHGAGLTCIRVKNCFSLLLPKKYLCLFFFPQMANTILKHLDVKNGKYHVNTNPDGLF